MRKKRYFICLCWVVMLILTMQTAQAKSGNKIIYIPENDIKKHGMDVLWLVVTGAPDKHMAYHKKMEKVAEWPYKIKLEGSSLHPTVL